MLTDDQSGCSSRRTRWSGIGRCWTGSTSTAGFPSRIKSPFYLFQPFLHVDFAHVLYVDEACEALGGIFVSLLEV